MYRLLIADDEALEREGLELIVERMLPGTFRVIHAENGRTAIEKAEEYRPHVVLMDIKMPGIHGLDALQEIKAGNPNVKMVLVTAYEQFDYAKQAISLGVKEYLTKPVRRDDIVALLKRIVQELELEKQARSQELAMKENEARMQQLAESELALGFMTHAIHATDVPELLDMLGMRADAGCAIVAAFPEFHPSAGSSFNADMRKAYDCIRDTVKHASLPFRTVVSPMLDRHMSVFLLGDEGEAKDALSDEALLLAGKLADAAEGLGGGKLSIGIGMSGLGISGIRRSYYEAVFASTAAGGSRQISVYGELPAEEEERPGQDREREDAVLDASGYVQMAIQRIREERDHQTIHLMDQAAAYIREHFREELSLEQAAEHVHLNPYYFSKVFKQYNGESFIDFVTRTRIEEAKALIAAGQRSLKEICYDIGYKDPNYFSRVFKKVAGISPSEYRSQQSP